MTSLIMTFFINSKIGRHLLQSNAAVDESRENYGSMNIHFVYFFVAT